MDELVEATQHRVRVAARRQLNTRFLDLREGGLQSDDVQQEANGRILKWVRSELTKPPDSIRSYFAAVRTIIRRTLLDFARQYNRTGRASPLPDNLSAGGEPGRPDHRVERIYEFLDTRSDEEREVFELKYLSGEEPSQVEIAQMMGKSEAWVSTTLRRLLRELTAFVGPDEIRRNPPAD